MKVTEDIKQSCSGKWLSIFDYFGIDTNGSKPGPCPICRGKDRFVYDNKSGNGDYFCRKCGPGDGLALIEKTTGLGFKEVIKKVDELSGSVKPKIIKEKNGYDVRKMLNDLWSSASELTGSDMVSKYLHSRGIVYHAENVRYCESCYESDTKSKMPAMIAKIQSPDGRPIAIHRTYLDGNKKAEIISPKKITPATEGLNGSAIRLRNHAGYTMGIAEGIETAMSASQLWGVPVWSVVNTSIMQTWTPPENIKKIIIFGDNDANFAGQKAAYNLAHRLIIGGYIVDVEIPDIIGDWNDCLKKIRRQNNG